MIGNLEIGLALKNHLLTLPSIPLLIIDGAGQSLPTGETYLTEKLTPTSKESPTVKGTGFQIATGFYQVDVRSPRGKGKWNQIDIADNIEELFKNAVSLPTTNGSVKILNTNSSPLRASGDHQAISVTVNYITAR